MAWWDEALSNELSHTLDVLVIFALICWLMYPEPEALSYEIFMWGDIGMSSDVRFYGVAPHWYFRPFMAWLIACPFHKTGIFGLLFFFFVLFFQPNIHGIAEQNGYNKRSLLFSRYKIKKRSFYSGTYYNMEINFYHQIMYGLFIMCTLYTTSFLPFGRFYNRLGGNVGFLLSYMFVFCYLAFPIFRRFFLLDLCLYSLYIRTNFLKNLSLNQVSKVR